MAFIYTNKAATSAAALNALITTFQVTDCTGTDVGDPIPVLQAAIMNKALVRICNTDEIAGNYNTPGRNVLTTGQNITLDADTYHSIAFKVVSGTGTIQFGADPAQDIEEGEVEEITASRLIDTDIIITCTTGKIVVSTLEETIAP